MYVQFLGFMYCDVQQYSQYFEILLVYRGILPLLAVFRDLILQQQ